MSKWVVITIATVLITMGIVIGTLIFLVKRSRAEDDAADEVYLRTKASLLNAAIDAQLEHGILSTEGATVVAGAANAKSTVVRSNNMLSSAIAKQRNYLSKLREKYLAETK